ncbi:IS66 family transposase [Roseobacter cerasinus]|nr:transposase [Roseobacter cerasinus]
MTSEFVKHSRLACELGGEAVQEPIEALVRLFANKSAAYEEAKALATKRSGEITHLKAQVQALKAEMAKQAQRIAELLHEQFGSKSEISVAQNRRQNSQKGNEREPSDEGTGSQNKSFAAERPKKPRNTSGRAPKNWDNLERIEVPMDFPKTCPCGCGGTIRTYDIDEKREVIPAKFYVAVRKYPRYRCREQGVTIGTLYKPTLMPGLTSGSSVLAYLVTMRFGWGIPWYRIENMLNHDGITYHRATMCNQVAGLAKALDGVREALSQHTLFDIFVSPLAGVGFEHHFGVLNGACGVLTQPGPSKGQVPQT